MDGGFRFDFDAEDDGAGCVAAPAAPLAPELMEPIPLHPLQASSVRDVLAAHTLDTPHGAPFESICVDGAEDVATGNSSHFLKHIVGVRIAELQAPADDEAAGLRDIVPGQYMGGLKVWSCAVDLAKAVFAAGREGLPATPPTNCPPMLGLYISLRNSMQLTATPRVLELGCGHGLPGMAALARGATDVTFHDYNQEVLQRCLLPNLCATFTVATRRTVLAKGGNSIAFNPEAVVRAVSGAWSSFAPSEPTTGEAITYDCVLGADVTYDNAVTLEAIRTIARLLRTGGRAYIGTKVYYFGTGGGRDAVMECLALFPRLRLVADVSTQVDGDAMQRCILIIEAHTD